MKRIWLCAVVASIVQMVAAYQTELVNGVEWKFTVGSGDDSDKAYLCSPAIPTATEGDIAIPSTLGGKTVVSIPDGAFCYCNKITSLYIPDSIIGINGKMVQYCSKLEKISIGKGITSAPLYAFSTKMYSDDESSMKSIVIRGGYIWCSAGTYSYNYMTDRIKGVKVYVSKEWSLPAQWEEYDVEYYEECAVDFDLGSHGHLVSGDLSQTVIKDWWPVVPKNATDSEWVFDGWQPSPSEPVESNTTYVATYHQIQCEQPAISPAEGSFSDVSQKITLSCGAGEKIYYTLDGSVPSEENGRLYKSPFTIYKTATVKAMSVRSDLHDSAIVTSVFTREDSIGEAANLLQYPMENDATYPWTVDADVSHDGISSIRSGGAGVKNVTSCAMTSVKRAGTVTFWWKADCEEAEGEEHYDYVAFVVDDEDVAKLAGKNTAWQKVSHTIPTGGKHVLRWEYRKDGATSRYSDCAWIDQIEWIPADNSGHTVTTQTPVPYSWLQRYGFGTLTDFETAANGASGKTQGDKATTVWEEFWIGTDPTNRTSLLTATIKLDNGTPVISWMPDLSTNATPRTYKVWGRSALDDESDWECPTNSLHRFFRVSLDAP